MKKTIFINNKEIIITVDNLLIQDKNNSFIYKVIDNVYDITIMINNVNIYNAINIKYYIENNIKNSDNFKLLSIRYSESYISDLYNVIIKMITKNEYEYYINEIISYLKKIME